LWSGKRKPSERIKQAFESYHSDGATIITTSKPAAQAMQVRLQRVKSQNKQHFQPLPALGSL
jgi:hypothetical protein